jgi:phosphoenolpyruvate synthase/pyruvate phosphate dikinase
VRIKINGSRLGSKADNLNILNNAGFNVPKFYVLEANYAKNINNLKITEHLITEFKKWKTENIVSTVAVRSSSLLEDSINLSFAGQFKTVLNVGEDDFIKALDEVFSSRQSKSYSDEETLVNAIVQEFIEPDIAGVMFTVNPANGNSEYVINSAIGRGTNVVDGQAAEQYLVNRLNQKIIFASDGFKTLASKQIKLLIALGQKIENIFESPQDIEWCIKDDQIYILQARPITKINHLLLWDSSNISESFPGIVLPLTFSIAKRGYLLGYKAQAYSAGLNWYELEAQHRTFDAMIGIFNGKLYYNLLNWYKFISLFPGSKRNQKFLDDQIATQGEAIYQAPVKQSMLFKLKFYIRIVYRATFFRIILGRFYSRIKRLELEISRMPKGGDSMLLMQRYTHIEQTIIPHFGRTLDNDFFVMTYHGLLKKLLTKWLPNHCFDKTSMIGSVNGVLSAEQATSLYNLAEKFKIDKTALGLLEKSDYDSLDKYLLDSNIRQSIQLYREVFGHRFAEDQKIEIPNPTLEPHGIYKLMEAYVKLDSEVIKNRINGSQLSSKKTENEIKDNLNFIQKIMYSFLLDRLKHHLRLREKNRLIRGRVYGYLRDLFPEIGEALVHEGVIESAHDVFYLQIEEIYQLTQASLVSNDLKDRIQKRKESYKKFKSINMPERFITKALPSLEEVLTINEKKGDYKVHSSLKGLMSSPGTVEGIALVLKEPKIPKEPYDILIASHTDPGWTPLLALAKGVVVEHGGMLSHAAIVTRELGIPSLIGVNDVTSIIKSGMKVRINSQTSTLEIIEK